MSSILRATMHVHGDASLRVVEVTALRLRVAVASRADAALLMRLVGAEPACYILIGSAPNGRLIAREGETADFLGRLRTHLTDHRLRGYDQVVAISGAVVTKAVARGMEYLASEEIAHAGRALSGAGRRPGAPRLREGEWPKVRDYFVTARTVLRGLGVDVLEPKAERDAHGAAATAAPSIGPDLDPEPDEIGPVFARYRLDYGDFQTIAAETAEGVFLLPGSEIRAREVASGRPCDTALRTKLRQTGGLRTIPGYPDRLLLTRPVWATSLDAAAKIVSGSRACWRHRWRMIENPSAR